MPATPFNALKSIGFGNIACIIIVINFKEIKAVYWQHIKHHLRHRPHVWRLLQQEEKQWVQYAEKVSSMAYDEYRDGSIRLTLPVILENQLLKVRIENLAQLTRPQLPVPQIRLLAYGEKTDAAVDTTRVQHYDFRCRERHNWYSCTQQQRRQLRPMLNAYRRVAIQTSRIPYARYQQEQSDWQAYHRAAVQFGKAMWHYRYAGEVWANYAVKSRIYAMDNLVVSNNFLPTAIIHLD